MIRRRIFAGFLPARAPALLFLGSAFLLQFAPARAGAQAAALPENRGFATVLSMVSQSCSSCHSWAKSHGGIADPARVTPYRPDESSLYLMVAEDQMPMTGPKLTGPQKLLLRAWIEAGATAGEEPLAAAAAPPAPGTASSGVDTGSGVTPPDAAGLAPAGAGQSAGTRNILGTIRYHQVAGYTSAGLLLAAGVVGTVKWVNFMQDGHDYRRSLGIEEPGGQCADYLHKMWNEPGQQALRWTHVGLLTAGNALYLGNAITGLRFPRDPEPGLTARRIHRYAFYTHAALMATNIVLGFLTTSVLEGGSHEQMLGLAVAHSAVGLAVPLVMIGAGVTIGLMR
jgi:mono/diheme cytochrome c family protein